MEKVVIVGGGIAGLSCLNALLDQRVSPLLLEGATIGTPKMCGEFLAPQAVSLLKNWDIGPPQKIHQAYFYSKNKKFDLAFSNPAGAISRSEVELLLAQRARKYDGRIRENSLIQNISAPTNSSPYIVSLATGEEIQADTVIFASGKYKQAKSAVKPLPYVGLKFHFKQVVKPATLLMYSIQDAYLGIVPISPEVSNCTCLLRRERVENLGSSKQFFNQLVENNATLKAVFENSDLSQLTWLEGRAPEFQLQSIPAWPRAYWIGDALAGLYPAIGSGFSHGISSAIMAAEFYLQNNPAGYLQSAKKILKAKLFLGKAMHNIMLNPLLASAAFPFLQYNPWFLNRCLRALGYQA